MNDEIYSAHKQKSRWRDLNATIDERARKNDDVRANGR